MSVDMQSVEISQLFSAGFACDLEGVEHRKTLPCLSVVQALHGYYEIGLDHKALVSTGQGGAFIAPANCFQRIIHHNGSEHVMRAHWVSMHVRVNTFYRLEDLYEFPRLFPPEENEGSGGAHRRHSVRGQYLRGIRRRLPDPRAAAGAYPKGGRIPTGR